jgi:4-aminobutyrate aminotransferase-like enzyme
MINAYSPDQSEGLSGEERALIERRTRALGPAYRLFYEHPVHVVRAEGVWLYGPDGEAYLDAYNNVAVTGHCHPHVTQAIAAQVRVLNTHTRYLNEDVVTYAERLLQKLPPALSNVMFTCTGSEANDLALRIARTCTGGSGVVVTETAYHGVTAALAELSPSLGQGVLLGPHVRTVPAPKNSGNVGGDFAAGVAAAFEDLRASGVKPAALLVDTLFSSDGLFPDPPGFLAAAADAARAAGALFIADEVQAGFGRSGTHFFGFARHGLTPDIVTMGKPMGAGHPLAGLASKPEILEAFGKASRYFNTFGGNQVSCAAGMAVLDVIEGEDLMQNAARVGAVLRHDLEAVAAKSAALGEVRGAGLFLAVDSADAKTAAAIVNGMRARRVLISATGPGGNVLKIRPPLVFSEENAAQFMDALKDVLRSI